MDQARRDITRLQIDKIGLEMFVGPLEAAVLRAMWDKRQSTRAIYRHVRDHYAPENTDDLAFTSVTSTVDRMYKRGWVKKSGTRDAYIYQPKAASEAEFVAPYLRAAVAAFLTMYPREVMQLVAKYVTQSKRSADNDN
jgi:predicted transcriptional regulator